MTGPVTGRLAAALGCLALVVLSWPAAAADTAPPAVAGDLWEVTTQMSMPGMPMQMPAQKSKVCTPREWKEPPAAADQRQNCVNSDFKTAGAKSSWKVVCAGPPPMTGEAEITRNGDSAYTGTIKLAGEGGVSMAIKLDGKRLDACDPTKK